MSSNTGFGKASTHPEGGNDSDIAQSWKEPQGSELHEISDGSTATYYELPVGATQLQDLISFKEMNAQIGEIFRKAYRYGQVSHSEKLRDAKGMKYYIEAEIERLEKYG